MSTTPPPRAVILLSGGLDSSTTLAIAKSKGYQTLAISFQYGQRHQHEIEASQRIAAAMEVAEHVVVPIDLAQFGGSALTTDMPVPKHQQVDQIEEAIPITYVPARNTVFLSLALAYAETRNVGDIFLGVNAVDYSGYPDCRPDFIAAYQQMANLATKGAVEGTLPVKIHAPLINLTKAEIISQGIALGVDYSLTTSCYDPTAEGLACAHCDACLLRLGGFEANNMTDPARYAV